MFRKITCANTLNPIRIKYNLPEKYILFVGNLEPKKNLERLIDAFVYLKKENAVPHKLIIVGKDGWKSKPMFRKMKESGLENQIICTGYADRQDLPAIYSMAALFAFPSLYEGFGLPVLEAMACETVVLISNRGALPEVAGAVFPQVDPTSVADMAKGIYECLFNEDLRQKNIRYGMERVKKFTWENAARQTLAVYDSL